MAVPRAGCRRATMGAPFGTILKDVGPKDRNGARQPQALAGVLLGLGWGGRWRAGRPLMHERLGRSLDGVTESEFPQSSPVRRVPDHYALSEPSADPWRSMSRAAGQDYQNRKPRKRPRRMGRATCRVTDRPAFARLNAFPAKLDGVRGFRRVRGRRAGARPFLGPLLQCQGADPSARPLVFRRLITPRGSSVAPSRP